MSHVETQVIEAGRRHQRTVPELWAYRELMYFLVWRDLKVRYQHTVLGVLWALIQPLMTMVIFTVVFGRLANMPSDGAPYSLFALAALVPWTYFSTAITQGAGSLVGNQHLVGKVYFPRLLIPLTSVITPAADAFIALLLLGGLLVFAGISPAVAIVSLPLFAALAVVTAFAGTLWLAALNVRFRDVRFAMPFLMQFLLFATPIAYPTSLVPERWRWVVALNPLATVVDGFRWTLVGAPAPDAFSVFVSVLVVAALAITGLRYFQRAEAFFADII
jgi:lipopolysaccharide transport system permease protein